MTMAGREPICLSWSGGKDAALALWHLRASSRFEVVCLQTTVTDAYDRSSIHGLRRTLLREQVDAVGLPLQEVVLPVPSSYDAYEEAMLAALEQLKAADIRIVAFGDLCLEDIREYREGLLARAGMEAVFPLWDLGTDVAAKRFIELGFRARLVVVDRNKLSGQFLGRPYDEALLEELPADVDPAGENGEFHTFVWDGPVFSRTVRHHVGATETQGQFLYLDIMPESG